MFLLCLLLLFYPLLANSIGITSFSHWSFFDPMFCYLYFYALYLHWVFYCLFTVLPYFVYIFSCFLTTVLLYTSTNQCRTAMFRATLPCSDPSFSDMAPQWNLTGKQDLFAFFFFRFFPISFVIEFSWIMRLFRATFL